MAQALQVPVSMTRGLDVVEPGWGHPLGSFKLQVKPAGSPQLNSPVSHPKFSDLICKFL